MKSKAKIKKKKKENKNKIKNKKIKIKNSLRKECCFRFLRQHTQRLVQRERKAFLGQFSPTDINEQRTTLVTCIQKTEQQHP